MGAHGNEEDKSLMRLMLSTVPDTVGKINCKYLLVFSARLNFLRAVSCLIWV